MNFFIIMKKKILEKLMSEYDYENCLIFVSFLNDKLGWLVIYLGICLYFSYYYVLDYECCIKYMFNVKFKDYIIKNVKL